MAGRYARCPVRRQQAYFTWRPACRPGGLCSPWSVRTFVRVDVSGRGCARTREADAFGAVIIWRLTLSARSEVRAQLASEAMSVGTLMYLGFRWAWRRWSDVLSELGLGPSSGSPLYPDFTWVFWFRLDVFPCAPKRLKPFAGLLQLPACSLLVVGRWSGLPF